MYAAAQNIRTKEIGVREKGAACAAPFCVLLIQCTAEIQRMSGVILNIDTILFKNTPREAKSRIGRQFAEPKTDAIVPEDTVIENRAEVMILIGCVLGSDPHIFKQAIVENKGAAGYRF